MERTTAPTLPIDGRPGVPGHVPPPRAQPVSTASSLQAMTQAHAKPVAGIAPQDLQGMVIRRAEPSPEALLREAANPELPEAQRESAMRRLLDNPSTWAQALVLKVARNDSSLLEQVPDRFRVMALEVAAKNPENLKDLHRIYILERNPELRAVAAKGLDAFSTLRTDAWPSLNGAAQVSYEAPKAILVGNLVKDRVTPEMNAEQVISALQDVSDAMGERVFEVESEGGHVAWVGIRMPNDRNYLEVEPDASGGERLGAKVLRQIDIQMSNWREDLQLRPLRSEMIRPITDQVERLLSGEEDPNLMSRDGLPPEVFEARRRSLIEVFEQLASDLRGMQVNPAPMQLTKNMSAEGR